MAATANQVRIIGGRHRGRRLQFTPGRGLRPTPGRVRETLFNWLRNDVHGARCLDLFAGSGAIGLEALSRGAGYLTFVDVNRASVRRLRDNVALLGEQTSAEVLQSDAIKLLGTSPQFKYDIVFVDPPFADRLLADVCLHLEKGDWLTENAMLYLEQDAKQDWPEPPLSWSIVREGRAGQSAQRLLRRSILR